MKTRSAIFLALFGLLSASVAQANDALLGAVIGGGVGAVVGNSIGGRDGALIGGALGAMTAVVLVDDDDYRRPSRRVYVPRRVVQRQVIYQVPPQPVLVEREVVYVPRHHRRNDWRHHRHH